MVRRFSAPDTVPHGGALQSISMSYADGFSIANVMDFQVGAEGEAIEFLGQEANAFRPTATADFHLGANTIFEYRYSTTEPNTRASKGFDTAPADLTESAPRMTMLNGDPLLENAHHHEMSLSERMGDNKVQLAYYNDRVKDPALLGVGVINTYTGDILPDPYSGTFSYNGGELRRKACVSSSSTACRTTSPRPSTMPTVVYSNCSSPAFPGLPCATIWTTAGAIRRP